MSVTITLGGVTMTGAGVTLTSQPPVPTVATAGWFSGGTAIPGSVFLSSVQRVTFATDTATTSTRGPLTRTRYFTAGTGNFYYGWIIAGSPSLTSVDRIDYSNDTATASLRGPIPATRAQHGATGNSTDGWFGGGTSAGATTSTITRINYATDTAAGSNKGPLNVAVQYIVATGTNTDGWFAGGGVFSPNTPMSLVQRITYATDTATASLRGPLNVPVITAGAVTDTSTYGWIGGGRTLPSSTSFSTMNRITYANDTITTSIRGPLSAARGYYGNGANDNTYGWFGGGYTSTVDRIDYANDTTTATPRGPLPGVVAKNAGTSGAQ